MASAEEEYLIVVVVVGVVVGVVVVNVVLVVNPMDVTAVLGRIDMVNDVVKEGKQEAKIPMIT